MAENHQQKLRNYTQLSYEQKEKIYKIDRHKFSQKAIAEFYGIHEKSVKKIIDNFQRDLKHERLSNSEIYEIAKSKGNKEVVNKILENKVLEHSIQLDEKSQELKEKTLDREANNKLRTKIIDIIDTTDDIESLTKIATILEKINSNTLKRGATEGIVSHAPVSSTQVNIQNNNSVSGLGGSLDGDGNYIPSSSEASQVAISFKFTTSKTEYENAVAKNRTSNIIEAEIVE